MLAPDKIDECRQLEKIFAPFLIRDENEAIIGLADDASQEAKDAYAKCNSIAHPIDKNGNLVMA